MKYDEDNVPDPYNWTVIDCRTGLEIARPGDEVVVEVDDVAHTITYGKPETRETDTIHCPRVVVDIPRKTVLAYYNPPIRFDIDALDWGVDSTLRKEIA